LRSLPLIHAATPGHDPDLHDRVRCSACHCRWTFGAFGLSASRLDTIPAGTDRTPEAWVLAWRFRRWECLILGVDDRGRVTALRPRYQYLISYGDRLGRTILDSVVPKRGDGSGPGWAFEPCTPHTTGRRGRICGDCHQNSLASGAGLEWAGDTDCSLLRASPPTMKDGRLLNPDESARLLDPGRGFRALHANILANLLVQRKGVN
jgi:hypothetical protein